jgi:outer membrane protein TolC
MKDLNVLKTLWLSFSLFCTVALGGTLADILSHNKRQMLRYDAERIELESDKLQKSWINPVIIRYNQNHSTQFRAKSIITGNFSVSIDQPIFRSGGIYNAVKYADAYRLKSRSEIAQRKQQLIADAVKILFELKKNRLQQEKLRHVIANDTIDIRQKRDSYEAGVLDSSFLDQAILKKSQDETNLLELKQYALELKQRFALLSDEKPENLTIPKFTLMDKARFKARHLQLQQDKYEAKVATYQSRMTVAKYLPALSLQATYINGDLNPLWVGVSNALKERYYNYGFSISMPLDINSFDDIESAKLAKLRAKVQVSDTERLVQEEYRWVLNTLAVLDKKIALAKADEKVYANLYRVTKNLVKAGEKTPLDAEVMYHSMQMRKLDCEIYEIDKQLQLLKLYMKVENAL